MKVYGFVGPSGTGKSYRVTEVASSRGIPLIIDDGLLIRGNAVLAGVSAKSEKTKFASVKRALFFESSHAAAVREAIQSANADRIIIVGTSVSMIEKIAATLSLPAPTEMIPIESVATAEEIETASRIRNTEGKHVIPVPTFAIKRDFSGYFLDPLQIFRAPARRTTAEKTIMRPTYSYLGDFTIANSVLITIGAHEAKKEPAVTKVWSCGVVHHEKSIDYLLELNFTYGTKIQSTAARITCQIKSVVEALTGIVVDNVEITVRQLDMNS